MNFFCFSWRCSKSATLQLHRDFEDKTDWIRPFAIKVITIRQSGPQVWYRNSLKASIKKMPIVQEGQGKKFQTTWQSRLFFGPGDCPEKRDVTQY